MNRQYAHILTWASSALWAVTLPKFIEIQSFLSFVLAGGTVDSDVVAEMVAASRRSDVQRSVDSIDVIPVVGTIVPRGNMLAQSSGATSVDSIRANLRAALSSPSKGILMAFNSPGGAVDGIEELADEVYRARKVKPIHAVADTLMASAAYTIGTQAERLSVTPSGEVGSVGVYTMHTDASKAMEMQGLKPTFISAGKYKVDGSPFGPLSETAKAHLTERVNDHYGQMTKAIARGRNATVDAVRGGFGEGRVVGSRQAVREGMADEVATFDEALAALARRIRQPATQTAAAQMFTVQLPPGTVTTTSSSPAFESDVQEWASIEAGEPVEQPEPAPTGLSLDSRRRRLERLTGV